MRFRVVNPGESLLFVSNCPHCRPDLALVWLDHLQRDICFQRLLRRDSSAQNNFALTDHDSQRRRISSTDSERNQLRCRLADHVERECLADYVVH